MNYSPLDTIVATATPPGLGGVAIVRISGSEALSILKKTVRHGQEKAWQPRHMYYCEIVDEHGCAIDKALAVYMPSPHSYTGEDVAEIHCHGGSVLASVIVDICLNCGARLAQPGEFTYRAFTAGKLDLAEAEAVLSLIEAKSKNAVILASKNLSGSLSQDLNKLKNDILDLISQYEAEIDYGDEIAASDTSLIEDKCKTFIQSVESLLQRANEGRALADGLETVLIGPPNAGKSTLWNALIGQDKALVTPYPGTTRDQLDEHVYVNGTMLHLIDTAGLHEAKDPVERLGIEKTEKALSKAELAVIVIDCSIDIESDFIKVMSDMSDKSKRNQDFKVLVILNKCDRGIKIYPDYIKNKYGFIHVCQASLKFSDGLENVKEEISQLCRPLLKANQPALSINQRQRQALTKVREALLNLESGVIARVPCDCLLLDLHACLSALNELTGDNVSEDILHRVFSKFCLGK
ncbi:MAG: tRNA uridine-5-carboxymethylaminomethyl(34) synthesis GTPase MnmE [Candidatus Bruticola sp.]